MADNSFRQTEGYLHFRESYEERRSAVIRQLLTKELTLAQLRKLQAEAKALDAVWEDVEKYFPKE